jgi:hypothetical protein
MSICIGCYDAAKIDNKNEKIKKWRYEIQPARLAGRYFCATAGMKTAYPRVHTRVLKLPVRKI